MGDSFDFYEEEYCAYDLCILNIPNDEWEEFSKFVVSLLPLGVKWRLPTPQMNKNFEDGRSIAWYIQTKEGYMGFDWMDTFDNLPKHQQKRFKTILDFQEVGS